MKNFWRNIKRLFSIYFGKMTIEKRLFLSHVERDWTIMLGMLIFVLIAMSAFSAWLFISVSEKNLLVKTESSKREVGTLDRAELKEIVELFESKKTNFEQLRVAPPEIPQPIK